MKLVVAVASTETDTGLFAAAVVYPAGSVAPRFSYTDRYGRRRVVELKQFNRLSPAYRVGILAHLKSHALSWAVVRHDDAEKAKILAVGRALERLAYSCQGGLHRQNVRLLVRGRTRLPEDAVGDLAQTLYAPNDKPWMLKAAALLAKAPRNDMVVEQ
jgi:hypothetical protein